MVQSLESSNVISAQEMHQRVLTQKMFSYDKDAKAGLSQSELNQFLTDSGEVPEFAKQLAARFGEVDQNKDGQVSQEELGSLKNDRGIWSVSVAAAGIAGAQSVAAAGTPTAAFGAPASRTGSLNALLGSQSSGGAMDLLGKNIQSLVKKGMTIANNNPQLMTKLEDVVHKII